MSVGTIIALIVLVEAIVLSVAVRWLVTGLRSAECREWPPIMPLGSTTALPAPREAAVRSEEVAAVS